MSQDRAEGKSVDDQLAECRAWARRSGWRLVAEHRDDGISASRYANGKARPGWQQVMDLITSGGVDLLVVWEISRATRDRAVWSALLAACAERGIRISTGGRVHDPGDPDDGFMLDLTAALAVRESAQMSKRIRRAITARAAEGRPHGKIAYGYRRVYDPVTRELVRQEPDPETSPVVREIAHRLLAGEATYAVTHDLNQRDIPAPRGDRWDQTQVKRLAISPTNAGLRSHKGEIVGPACWPALISEGDHRLLVDRLTDPTRKTVRDGSVKHLLSMIAVCGVCGCPCRRIKNRNIPSYQCWPGFCVTRAQAPLDTYVTDVLLARLSRPDVLELFAERPSPETSEAAAQLAVLRDQYRQFEIEAIAGRVSAASWGRIETRLFDKIKTLERRIRPRGLPQVLTDITGAPDVAAVWAGLTVPQQRELIRVLLVPRILRARKGCRFDPDHVEIVWRTG